MGHPALLLHLGTVVGLMKIHTDYEQFYKQLNAITEVYPDDPTLHPGPRVPQTLELLARLIHPEAFGHNASNAAL